MKVPVGKTLLHLLLLAFAAITLTPMLWLVSATFKPAEDLFRYTFFGPRFFEYTWEEYTYNLRNLFASIPFGRYLINSFFIACSTVIIQLVLSSLGGFALAKYEFRGKRLVLVLMLLTMMLPAPVMVAPLYELIYRMGLVDTYLGLLVPGAVSVFGMFLFRQSMLHIPDDLIQSGRVDGCSEFRVYLDIVLPVSRPMIGAFSLISFMSVWNSFLWPQIVLHTRDRFTLTIGLNQMVGIYDGNEGAVMAGTLVSVLPVVVLFFLLQKEFISGLTAGAVKG